jgi:outer membrane receptor protein involved in Fe transport
MFRKTQVRTAVLAVVGGMAGLAAPGYVFAQTPAPAPAAAAETVTVTGSRIKRTELSSAPIAEVGAEEFKLSGATRVEDLLNTLPQLSSDFDSFTVNPTTGFATIDLRGLGSGRTLVLVNGQRLQPGGIRSEARDINQIPAALIKRVDILTGGASAVYGADAMAGVVNFILDTEFEGFSGTVGWSGYRHKNDNAYIQRLMDARGFSYPKGTSGPDGQAENVDLALGSSFADGKGHAMAYFTWRQNDELRQGARDYSSCALNALGTACGGSGTSPIPNFLVAGTIPAGFDFNGNGTIENNERNFNFRSARLRSDGGWEVGAPPAYNYAPINHYQRPDTRWTLGSSVKYEVNKHFRPYLETMFSNTNTSVQIAESGTFFVNDPAYSCTDPLVGTLCADLGIDPAANDLQIYVGKRNVEGGPRVSKIESNSFRAVSGVEGDLVGGWSYNLSYLYGRNSSNEVSENDFITNRIDDALRGCPAGSFDGCVPYNVWVPNGVTAEAASKLAGTGIRTGATSLEAVNFYVTGDLPFTIPSARNPVSLVVGVESRSERYRVDVDANWQAGAFAGGGGPRTPIDGKVGVKELFLESTIPLFASRGFLKSIDADVGYRSSDYSTSGNVNSYKVGGNVSFGPVRVRAGFNRAIRQATTGDLFSDQQIGLFSGSDPCAGATPAFTLEQCRRTGVTDAQYGSISASPANQYNQFTGGNPNLKPEQGDTITLGLVVNPIRGMSVSLDYYSIEITERIGTIGASSILNFCGRTGDPFLCSKIRRGASGDLWIGSDPATSGRVENLTANFGDLKWEGLDLGVQYETSLFGGKLFTGFQGTLQLKQQIAPLPGINDGATYDCVGTINTSCQSPEWKHSLSFRYSKDWWTANIRWRHIGELEYVNTDGTQPPPTASTTDRLLRDNGYKLNAFNYLDVSGSVKIGKATTLAFGINNVFDKEPPMVGSTLVLNANSIGGYDQIGQYLFANVNVRF